MKVIANNEELDKWCFEMASRRHHTLRGIKGHVEGIEGFVNIAWVDTTTGVRKEVIYEER